MDLKAGASSSPPALRIATPVAVPLVSSSNFDCSQVRVPSAKTGVIRPAPQRLIRRKLVRKNKNGFRKLSNFHTSKHCGGEIIQVITGEKQWSVVSGQRPTLRRGDLLLGH